MNFSYVVAGNQKLILLNEIVSTIVAGTVTGSKLKNRYKYDDT